MTDQQFSAVDEILPASLCNTDRKELRILADATDQDLGTSTAVQLGPEAVLVSAGNVRVLVEALVGEGGVRAEVSAADIDYDDRPESARVILVANERTEAGKVQVNLVLVEGFKHVEGQVSREDLRDVLARVIAHFDNDRA